MLDQTRIHNIKIAQTMKVIIPILAAILLIIEKQSVLSSPRMQILLRNVTFVNVDPTLVNVSATISKAKTNITVITYRSFDGLYVDMHLDVRMLNNPSKNYERFLDKSVNFCDAMANPLLDPLVTMAFTKAKDEKLNKIFTKCPVPVVGLVFIYFMHY